MNKSLILLTLSVPLLVSCSCSQTGKDIKRKDEEVVIPTEINKKVSELKEDEYKTIPSYILARLKEFKSYKAVTSGSTNAEVVVIFPITTTQSINATVIKGEEYSYLKNESHSSLVNTVHTAYFKGEQTVSSNGGDYEKLALPDYLNRYGTYPFDNAIEGYTITDNDIESVNKLESDENYKFEIMFNVKEAVNNVKIQMREFGGLDDYPSISEVKITVNIKNDFTPVTMDLESKYTAKKGMDSSCTQKYMVSYSNFDEKIEIPGLDNIKNKFDTLE